MFNSEDKHGDYTLGNKTVSVINEPLKTKYMYIYINKK